MIDELVDLEEDIDVPSPLVDLNDPQPWFLKFSEPILEEEKKDDKPMFPWPPGAPRPLITKTEVTLQEVLNFICTPIKITEDGYHWKQQVSDEQSNRTYEAFLKKCLNDSLTNVRSRFSGFCPYRNKVYRDMFSEVIRVVTVGMKERGLLLLRVKDDIDTTVDRLDKLYRSSMRYGLRKQMKVEGRKLSLELNRDDLKEETFILSLMSKNFITKTRAAVIELKDRKEKLLDKKLSDLELLKRVTCVIEKSIFQVICSETERQRKRFLKACLLFKDATEPVEEKELDITGLFTEVKTPTPSSSTIFVREPTTSYSDHSSISSAKSSQSSGKSNQEAQ